MLTLSGVVNVILNLALVLVVDLSVEGVAIATVVANAVSAVLLIARLLKDKTACRLRLKKLRIHMKTLGRIVEVGFPAAVQSSLFSLSNMLIQSSIVKVNNAVAGAEAAYQPVVKGNSACSSVEGFIYTVIDSVGKASVSFVGQNAGAKKYDRLSEFLKIAYLTSFVVGVISPAIVLLLRNPLLALYGVRPAGLDKTASDPAVTRMLIMFVPYFTIAFMQLGSGVLQGLGKAVSASVSSLIGACLFRVIWIFTVFAAKPTIEIIYLSYPISWVLVALSHLIMIRKTLKKLRASASETAEEGKAANENAETAAEAAISVDKK